MNVHQIRNLILKLFGVYGLFISFSWIQLVLGMLSEHWGARGGPGFLADNFFFLAVLVVWIVLAWTFLRRTDAIRRRIWPEDAGDATPVTLPKTTMAFWVAVVGLYEFLQSVDTLPVIGWRAVMQICPSELPSTLADWVVQLAPCVLSAVCVLRARDIGAWIAAPIGHGAAAEPGENA